jgi:hypothetical protein
MHLDAALLSSAVICVADHLDFVLHLLDSRLAQALWKQIDNKKDVSDQEI